MACELCSSKNQGMLLCQDGLHSWSCFMIATLMRKSYLPTNMIIPVMQGPSMFEMQTAQYLGTPEAPDGNCLFLPLSHTWECSWIVWL